MCVINMAISICVLDMGIPICVLDNRSWQQNGDQPQLKCFEIYIYAHVDLITEICKK